MTTNDTSALRRWRLRRLFWIALIVLLAVFAFLQSMRVWAEKRSIPVVVMESGPPGGPLAAQMKLAGMTNVCTWVPYEQLTNPPVSLADLAAMKHCLARERFLPLFPVGIQIRPREVNATYGMRINRRTGRVRETVVPFIHETNTWRLGPIYESTGRICTAGSPTLWDKVLSYLPFTD